MNNKGITDFNIKAKLLKYLTYLVQGNIFTFILHTYLVYLKNYSQYTQGQN